MNSELKKVIFLYMNENANDFQLVINTFEKFKQYIYLPDGNYCIVGKEVSEFIEAVIKL
jgi:DNA polymerase II large subunit